MKEQSSFTQPPSTFSRTTNRVAAASFSSSLGSKSIASASSEGNKRSGLPAQTGADSEPTKEVVYPHVSLEEILRNASVIRYNYYENLPYPYINYTYGSTFCSTYDKEMPKTTATVLKRSYMKLNKKWSFIKTLTRRSSVTWSNYMLKKR